MRSSPEPPGTEVGRAPSRGPLRSLTGRVVALAAVVALASSLLTALVLTRALVASNREQASATLVLEADALAALVEDGRRVRAARKLRALDGRAGWAAEVVPRGGTPTVSPFTAADVTAADVTAADVTAADVTAADVTAADVTGADVTGAEVTGLTDDAAPVERAEAGGDWFVVARPAGDQSVLLARRVGTAVRLTAVQRRRTLIGGLLGLVGGGLAGLGLALSLTRPLGRLAAAARRLSAGERDVVVPPQGPAEVADVAEALGALSRALSASDQPQRQFLLAVSHELRTPLTAVAGYAEALADHALPPAEVPHAAEVIVTEAGRLQRRVGDLLALARLEADDFRLAPAPTDVGALVRAAGASLIPRATAAGVRLAVHAPDAGPVIVTDGERLRQAVGALADNALKVLGAGAPLVLACRPLPDGGVGVEVRDGGPGLTPEDLAVAFERGRLTERYRGSRPVGSGVGLALVGELTRRLGGLAQANPAPEGGVCFTLTLPATPPPTLR